VNKVMMTKRDLSRAREYGKNGFTYFCPATIEFRSRNCLGRMICF